MTCLPGTLGTPAQYGVYVADRGGTVMVVAESLPYATVSWTRQLDATSTATVTIPTGQAPDCCGLLSDVRAGRHELVLYRDTDRVWEGPITSITATRDTITITAADMTQWLAWRGLRHKLCWGADGCDRPATDASEIARQVIADAMALEDDPNLLPYVQTRPAGVADQRAWDQWTYAIDALNDLARTTLDYTTAGRAILVGGPLTFGALPTLTCDAFADDVATIDDAASAATRVIVVGAGAITAIAGGPDRYYGLIERIVNDDSITDQTTAAFAARQILATSRPPLVYVTNPQGTTLSPDAPVGINQLVCGAMIPVDLDCTCRPARTVLRLTNLDVTWDLSTSIGDASAPVEQVKVTLTPLTNHTGT